DIYRKMSLPSHGVFDERRYFRAGKDIILLKMGEVKIGITIGEDIWNPAEPLASLSLGCGVHLVANISASPYYTGKPLIWEKYLSTKSYDYHVALACCNMVGGQDELVFDGTSMVSDASGKILVRGSLFEEEMITED
ncbi:MAG TPA: nitrilase-related carbon-nitrogen hydrolase, partial [Candidatus Atribacteria bacterium]|nr:nitrilase-related carbon-nitrogen hydrolase [Candidatus Atribacteria bacterium]